MSPASFIGLLIGVAGVITILGTGFVVLRSTLARTTSELWKQEADALRTRLVTVEESDSVCKTRLSALETTNKVLSEQVSGLAAIAALTVQVNRQHVDIMNLLGGKRQSDA